MELLVGLVLLVIIVLTLTSITTFSHFQTTEANRKILLQQELAYTIEHMSKRIIQATGDQSGHQPITLLGDGFSVRVDLNYPATAQNLDDDATFSYTLAGNTLSCSCAGTLCPSGYPLVLATHILPNVVRVSGAMPNLDNSNNGFYMKAGGNNTSIEVGLVARYSPGSAISTDNPQVAMQSYMRAQGAAAN